MRKEAFGEKGSPKVSDSLFTLARMLEEEGELSLTAN